MGNLENNVETIDVHTHPDFIHGRFELKHLVDACIQRRVSAIGIVDSFKCGEVNFRYSSFSDNGLKELPENYELARDSGRYSRRFVVRRDGNDIVQFYRGQEVATSEGHVLLFDSYGFVPSEENGKPTSMEDTIARGKDQGAVVIATHPFVPRDIAGGMGRKVLCKHKKDFDALEWNAQCVDLLPQIVKEYVVSTGLFYKKPFDFLRKICQGDANKAVQAFAKESKIPLVAASDMHMPGLWFFEWEAYRQIGLGSITFGNPNGKGERFELRDVLKGDYHVNMEGINGSDFIKWVLPLRLKRLFKGSK